MKPGDFYDAILRSFRDTGHPEESGRTVAPSVAELVERVRAEIQVMCRQSVEMLTLVAKAFRTQQAAALEPAKILGEEIHLREKALTDIIVKHLAREAGMMEANKAFLFVPMHLERVGDNIEFLIRAIGTMIKEGIPFTERAMGEINSLFEKAIEILECVRDTVPTNNKVLMQHIVNEGKQFEDKVDEFALLHQQRMIEAVGFPRASSMYLAILDYLKGIESHSRQIGLKLLDQGAS
jgi:Na+/phosphate symporter